MGKLRTRHSDTQLRQGADTTPALPSTFWVGGKAGPRGRAVAAGWAAQRVCGRAGRWVSFWGRGRAVRWDGAAADGTAARRDCDLAVRWVAGRAAKTGPGAAATLAAWKAAHCRSAAQHAAHSE